MNTEKQKILVIEDEPQILEFLSIALSINGYEVITACDGVEGLKLALSLSPDLIISDIMMPLMDGYKLLEEIRNHPETATTPMLLLSARSDKNDIRHGMNLGADDYLTKPFDIDDLLSAIKSQLEKKHSIKQQLSNKLEDLRSSIRSNLPHEIRTPINIILGYSNILIRAKDYSNTEDVREMIESIQYGAQRLNHLFENYLLYASLELMDPIAMRNSNENKIVISDDVFFELVNREFENENRIQDLELQIIDSEIEISEYYFTKLVSELVNNAFKFSDKGSKVKVYTVSELGYYKIKVIDYGRGMSKSQIESIGAYQQFDRELYEQQGAGLGLAISKKIAEIYECHFAIHSEQGKGTQVDVWIPLARR